MKAITKEVCDELKKRGKLIKEVCELCPTRKNCKEKPSENKK